MKTTFLSLMTFTILMVGCNSNSNTNSTTIKTEEKMNEVNLKSLAESAMTAFFGTYDEAEVRKLFKEDYIQHNPYVPTGIEPVVGLLPTLKENGMSYITHRIIQDGDYVVLHNSFSNAQAFGVGADIVTFDMWRMEDGKVAEHWDAVTPVVTETVSGRSQTDGPTEIIDLEKTEENKALVKEMVNKVFIGGEADKITDYISTEQYDQHNPQVGDGLSGLTAAIEYLTTQNNMFKYFKVHKVLGEGNFVLVQSEGEWNNKPSVFYDLWRVENGKVVEHWDVVNEIPEKMAHENGMF